MQSNAIFARLLLARKYPQSILLHEGAALTPGAWSRVGGLPPSAVVAVHHLAAPCPSRAGGALMQLAEVQELQEPTVPYLNGNEPLDMNPISETSLSPARGSLI